MCPQSILDLILSLEFSLMLVVSDHPELVIMTDLNWATVTAQNHMRIRVVEMRNNLLDKLSEKIRGQSWSNGLNLDSAWLEVEKIRNKGGHDETGWKLMSLCNWVSCGFHIVRSSIFNSFLWVYFFVGKNELDLLIRIYLLRHCTYLTRQKAKPQCKSKAPQLF